VLLSTPCCPSRTALPSITPLSCLSLPCELAQAGTQISIKASNPTLYLAPRPHGVAEERLIGWLIDFINGAACCWGGTNGAVSHAEDSRYACLSWQEKERVGTVSPKAECSQAVGAMTKADELPLCAPPGTGEPRTCDWTLQTCI
jgi:hypothetical protein